MYGGWEGGANLLSRVTEALHPRDFDCIQFAGPLVVYHPRATRWRSVAEVSSTPKIRLRNIRNEQTYGQCNPQQRSWVLSGRLLRLKNNLYKFKPGQHTMKIESDPVNALTVDVEDYYQVEAFADVIGREDWRQWESRVERNTHRLLDLFARHDAKGTFFILGWIAERHPNLVREVSGAGHEIACHGHDHQLIRTQSPAVFRADIRRAKQVLEDVIGCSVLGYRAPTYSVTTATLWALDVLIEEGFEYDSSIFPIHHDRYGIPQAERFPHVIYREVGEIIEFPPSTLRLAGQNFPVAGGGYFRLLPYSAFRWALRRINRREAESAIFMVHAWEVDPEQPNLPGTRLNVWRHRVNLHRTEGRLELLLHDFRFAPVREVLRNSEIRQVESELCVSEQLYAPMARPMARMD
jgi:polysaccharide deacetylase family protein (PEP-CTERM system associated)